VLVETMAGADSSRVILEDGQLRRFGHLSRTRIAGSAIVAAHLDDLLHRCVESARLILQPDFVMFGRTLV